MRIVSVLAAMATLAACAPSPSPQPLPAPGTACDAGPVQSYIGQPFSDALAERARAEAGARTVRSYGVGDPVTMDFRPDRLNVERGADGRIVRLGCG
ncbi:I78 family peptidase inhibitor [Sphingomonas sp.]